MTDAVVLPSTALPQWHVRTMRPSDLAAVMAVQMACHDPDNIEDAATLAQRLAVAPDTAWVVDANGSIVGYLVAYRARLHHVPPLGSAFAPATAPDCLYLHDLAIVPEARGQGWVDRLMGEACAWAQADGLPHMAMVSLHSTVGYWGQRGFAPGNGPTPEQTAALASYAGGQAVYLIQATIDAARRFSTARG